MKNIALHLTAMVLLLASGCQNTTPTTEQKADNIYQFTVENNTLKAVDLNNYKGKVLLVVNTASHCGFTPQYNDLEAMYKQLHEQGFEILDFPCNQFGEQAPETDEEYVSFCRLNYQTEFRQFHKIDVNGENELPLYTYLKEQQPFVGFDADHPLTPLLEKMFDENMPGWRETADIKWNFTKFLIDREGNVVARFEPTATAETMLPIVQKYLK